LALLSGGAWASRGQPEIPETLLWDCSAAALPSAAAVAPPHLPGLAACSQADGLPLHTHPTPPNRAEDGAAPVDCEQTPEAPECLTLVDPPYVDCKATPQDSACEGFVDCESTPDAPECLVVDCTVTPDAPECQVGYCTATPDAPECQVIDCERTPDLCIAYEVAPTPTVNCTETPKDFWCSQWVGGPPCPTSGV
jgi:hypothetical protein